jgi:preprotein translocase subunit SecE
METTWYSGFTQFFKEAYAELQKATWLSRKEAVASTIVILILVVIIAIFVGIADFVLSTVLAVVL